MTFATLSPGRADIAECLKSVPTADSAYLEFTSGKDHASAIIAHVVPSPAHSRRALRLGGRKWFAWDGSRVGLHALRSKLPDQMQKAVHGQDLNPVARWRSGIYRSRIPIGSQQAGRGDYRFEMRNRRASASGLGAERRGLMPFCPRNRASGLL